MQLTSINLIQLLLLVGALLGTFQTAGALAQTQCDSRSVTVEEPRGTPYSSRMAELARGSDGSSTIVVGDSIAARWPSEQLEKIFGGTVLNLAVGGDHIENSVWMLGQVSKDRARATHNVLIVVGTNNLRSDDECAYDKKIRAMMDRLAAAFPHAKIYVFDVLPRGRAVQSFSAKIEHVNRIFATYSRSHGFAFVEANGAMTVTCSKQDSCSLLEADRLHPNREGYNMLSRILKASK